MTFYILTLFPSLFDSYLKSGLVAKSIASGNIKVNIVDWREYSDNKHKKVDDTIYGGGPGMLLKCEPLYRAMDAIGAGNKKNIFLTPKGKSLTQARAEHLSKESEIVLVCGAYEGFDSRIFSLFNHEKISIGDFVISNGNLAALVLMDTVTRLSGKLFKNPCSLDEESFKDGLVEYNQYTRPSSFANFDTPSVLLSGNHSKIEKYRKKSSIFNTMENRPDLIEKALFSLDELEIMSSFFDEKLKKKD